MRKVVHKLFWIWDFEKEEEWLNEMAAMGLSLISIKLFAYEFESTLPGEYHVCSQVLEHSMRHPETENYIHFLEETGVQHVVTCIRSAYFRKKAADGQFNLFSDYSSRIKHMNHIITLLSILICPNFFNLCMSLCNYVRFEFSFYLFNAVICVFPIVLLCIGITKLSLKKKKLKEEQQIFE